MEFRQKSWIIYAWLREDGEPYYLSKCRKHSPAPYQPRASETLQPPPRNRIKTLFESTDEQEVLQKLDELLYELGLEEAAPGFGKLKNSIRHSPLALREKSHGQTTPVTVYKLDGSKVGDFKSCGDAAYSLNLKKGSVSMVLQGKNYHHKGFVITHQGSPFRKRQEGKRYWKSVGVVGFDVEGNQQNFESIPDAALEITGDRSKTSNIWGSVYSPTDAKRTYKGWVFFDAAEVPKYSEVKRLRRGRPKLAS